MKEIVIKIPDKMYSNFIKYKVYYEAVHEQSSIDPSIELTLAVINGKVLPNGHDKLIAEPTEEEIAKTIGGNNEFSDCIREAVKAVFNNANAVVEADKGDE